MSTQGPTDRDDRDSAPAVARDDVLHGRRIALGVSGSIAAYKALTVASRLTASGASVDVLLTAAAAELVRALAFQALTHRPVITSLWEPTGALALDHVAVARAADALVVAPATADTLARLSLGRADDALTTTALATRAPLLVAPAMEPQMWSHPATQSHIATLRERGARVVGPAPGRMASGQHGRGRLVEPPTLLEHVRALLGADGPLAGRHVLVTGGPTREPLDPVRFLTNGSSGRMGIALARAARDRGAAVTLISGPTGLPQPPGVTTVAVTTASEMHDAVLDHITKADALLMSAAVADYRPATTSQTKIKKAEGPLALELTRTRDVLLAVRATLADADRKPVIVGFAAETEDEVARAREKLERKGCDLVVANRVPDSFDRGDGRAVLVSRAGQTALEVADKDALAARIVSWLVERLR